MATNSDNEPLHLAVKRGQLERVRELLDSGTKPDIKDIHHRTPLMIAADYGYTEIAKLLIERGADINAKSRRSEVWEGRCTPLFNACEAGRHLVVKLLLESGADPDCISQSWFTPLSNAILGKKKQIVDYLLEHGANPNGPAKCFMSPLESAATNNDVVMVKDLLQRGADPNRIGGTGGTALAATNSLECASELLVAGADSNLKNRDGLTVLQSRLLVIGPEFVSALIKAGANVNETSEASGITPLLFLAMTPRFDNAQILIEAGADVNALSHDGKTPLDICEIMLTRANDDIVRSQATVNALRQDNGRDLADKIQKDIGMKIGACKSMINLLQQHGGKRAKDL